MNLMEFLITRLQHHQLGGQLHKVLARGEVHLKNPFRAKIAYIERKFLSKYACGLNLYDTHCSAGKCEYHILNKVHMFTHSRDWYICVSSQYYTNNQYHTTFRYCIVAQYIIP
jgi:hypothetical protein